MRSRFSLNQFSECPLLHRQYGSRLAQPLGPIAHRQSGHSPPWRGVECAFADAQGGTGSATPIRRLVVQDEAACGERRSPGRPSIEATRTNETMMRAVTAFAGRAVSNREHELLLRQLHLKLPKQPAPKLLS